MSSPGELTRLLQAWSSGDLQALDTLTTTVAGELRRLARGQLRREQSPSLQPTDLINELYVRIAGREGLHWESRVQFFAFAAEVMRDILVDRYRACRTGKRGGGVPTISLDEAMDLPHRREVDLLELDNALRDLESLDRRQSRVVKLRFFAGLTLEETAQALGLSVATVRREWNTAKSWLLRELQHR